MYQLAGDRVNAVETETEVRRGQVTSERSAGDVGELAGGEIGLLDLLDAVEQIGRRPADDDLAVTEQVGAIRGFERVQDEGEGHWVVMLNGIEDKLDVSRRQQHVVREFVR